jgi:hypothetical protein
MRKLWNDFSPTSIVCSFLGAQESLTSFFLTESKEAISASVSLLGKDPPLEHFRGIFPSGIERVIFNPGYVLSFNKCVQV